MRIGKAKLLKWKYCETEETFLQYRRGGDQRNKKNRLKEIKQENWKTFCEARIRAFGTEQNT
jgi:hypothetical protein